ncbi:hypothetical protein G6F40_014973 [Rhizopus arrhizus]|nr:hypothetical protein G6F40_014973 [Rhizopus arrhizus]
MLRCSRCGLQDRLDEGAAADRWPEQRVRQGSADLPVVFVEWLRRLDLRHPAWALLVPARGPAVLTSGCRAGTLPVRRSTLRNARRRVAPAPFASERPGKGQRAVAAITEGAVTIDLRQVFLVQQVVEVGLHAELRRDAVAHEGADQRIAALLDAAIGRHRVVDAVLPVGAAADGHAV